MTMPGVGLGRLYAERAWQRRDLSDAGHQISERLSLEQSLSVPSTALVSAFLISSESYALDALESPVVLAAAHARRPEHRAPLTLGRLLSRWGVLVEEFIDSFRSRAPARLLTDDSYVTAVRQRLMDLPMSERVMSTVTEAVRDGMERNLPTREIARSITASLSFEVPPPEGMDWQGVALRVARTESTAAYNQATLLHLMDQPEHFTHKRWVSRHDDLTRPTHLGADGQTVPLTDSFVVGTSAMTAPGDPLAPPAETANCRCVIIGVRTKPGAHRRGRD